MNHSDYHWQPLANQTCTFDLAKISEMPAVAGYQMRNGARLDK